MNMNKNTRNLTRIMNQKESIAYLLNEKRGMIKKIMSPDHKIVAYLLRSEVRVDKERSEADVAMNFSVNCLYKNSSYAKNTFARTMRTFAIKHLMKDFDTYKLQKQFEFSREDESKELKDLECTISEYMKDYFGISTEVMKSIFERFIAQTKNYYKDIHSFRIHFVTNIDDLDNF